MGCEVCDKLSVCVCVCVTFVFWFCGESDFANFGDRIALAPLTRHKEGLCWVSFDLVATHLSPFFTQLVSYWLCKPSNACSEFVLCLRLSWASLCMKTLHDGKHIAGNAVWNCRMALSCQKSWCEVPKMVHGVFCITVAKLVVLSLHADCCKSRGFSHALLCMCTLVVQASPKLINPFKEREENVKVCFCGRNIRCSTFYNRSGWNLLSCPNFLTILYLPHKLMFLMHLLIFFDKLGMSLKALEDLVIHPGLWFHVLYAPSVATWSVFECWVYFSRHWRLSQWVTLCMQNEGF